MKFLCDVHIPLKLSKYLESLGYSSNHVNYILNKWNTSDSQIIEYVDEFDLILITKDQDFKNEYLLNSKPKKLLKINLGNSSNKELKKNVIDILNKLEELDKTNEKFMIEVSKGNSRITIK